MLVPVVTTLKDSAAPSGWLVNVSVAEARFPPSTSTTVAAGATATGPESSVNPAVAFEPAPTPLRSTTGASLTQVTDKVTVPASVPPWPSSTANPKLSAPQ